MRISGLGCYVIDLLYYDVDLSKNNSLNFIHYGEATLIADIEEHSNMPIQTFLKTNLNCQTAKKRLGGVSVIGLIEVAQLLSEEINSIQYYANISKDTEGSFILSQIKRTPLSLKKIMQKKGKTPYTYVLCDTNSANGGTRSFICDTCLDISLRLQLEQLDTDFYTSDIVFFSCIQWESTIAKNLSKVLFTCKKNNAFVVVGTASDPQFTNNQWILGDGPEVYSFIDVLIMDFCEAMHYSNATQINDIITFFKYSGVKSIIITQGMDPVIIRVFDDTNLTCPYDNIPIALDIEWAKTKGELSQGDSVGCGDNFAGGVVTSLAKQKIAGKSILNLSEAVLLGNICGGITSTIQGGAFFETYRGEKEKICQTYLKPYTKRIQESFSKNKIRQ